MPYNNVISRTDAAALIPEDASAEIWKHTVAASAAMTLFRQRRLSRNQQRVPVESVLPTAYFVAGEPGIKQTTELNWTNKFLNVEELACIVPIPEAVLDDSAFDIWGEARPALSEAIGRALDAAVFFGINKPASWPTDIAASAVAAGNTVTQGTATAANGGLAGDISALFGTVEADGYDVNGMIANRTYRGTLRNVRNSQGDKLPEVTTDQAYGVPITYPMRGLWPTGAGSVQSIAGDFNAGILGIRQDITFKVLDQAIIQDNAGVIQYNLAQQDMVALRVVFRVAWQVANPINYDQATEASRFPFGVIKLP